MYQVGNCLYLTLNLQTLCKLGDKAVAVELDKTHLCSCSWGWFGFESLAGLSPKTSSCVTLFIWRMDVLSSTSFRWQEWNHLSLSSQKRFFFPTLPLGLYFIVMKSVKDDSCLKAAFFFYLMTALVSESKLKCRKKNPMWCSVHTGKHMCCAFKNLIVSGTIVQEQPGPSQGGNHKKSHPLISWLLVLEKTVTAAWAWWQAVTWISMCCCLAGKTCGVGFSCWAWFQALYHSFILK